MVGLYFSLWGSVGTNAVSHHPPGSQLPITVLLFLTDQPANPSQQATVKIQSHLDNAVTLHLKCLSFILLSEKHLLSFCYSVCSFAFSISHTVHTNTDAALIISYPSFRFILATCTLCFTSLDQSHLSKCFTPVITFLLTYQYVLYFPFPFILFSLLFFPLPRLTLQAKTSWGRPLSSCTPTGQTGTMATCGGRPC